MDKACGCDLNFIALSSLASRPAGVSCTAHLNHEQFGLSLLASPAGDLKATIANRFFVTLLEHNGVERCRLKRNMAAMLLGDDLISRSPFSCTAPLRILRGTTGQLVLR